MKLMRALFTGVFVLSCMGCAGTSKPVQKITKPVDQTAEELVKVREFKSEEGETRAVVSPTDADTGQFKIKF